MEKRLGEEWERKERERKDGQRRNCPPDSERSDKSNNKEMERKREGLEGSKAEIKMRAIEIIGESLSAISNDTRIKIARYVQEHKNATFEELRTEFNLNNNTLMFHLKKLKEAYIISQAKNRSAYSMGKLGDIMLTYYKALESEVSSVWKTIQL